MIVDTLIISHRAILRSLIGILKMELLWWLILLIIHIKILCILAVNLYLIFLLGHSCTSRQRNIFPLSISIFSRRVYCDSLFRELCWWMLLGTCGVSLTMSLSNFIVSKHCHLHLIRLHNLLFICIVHKFLDFGLSLVLNAIVPSLVRGYPSRAHRAALLSWSHDSWLRTTRPCWRCSNFISFLALFEIFRYDYLSLILKLISALHIDMSIFVQILWAGSLLLGMCQLHRQIGDLFLLIDALLAFLSSSYRDLSSLLLPPGVVSLRCLGFFKLGYLISILSLVTVTFNDDRFVFFAL